MVHDQDSQSRCIFLPQRERERERKEPPLSRKRNAIARKIQVADKLPAVPYMTSLEKYLMCCYPTLIVQVFVAKICAGETHRRNAPDDYSLLQAKMLYSPYSFRK